MRKWVLALAVLVAAGLVAWRLCTPGPPPLAPVDGSNGEIEVWASSGALADLATRILGPAHPVRRVVLANGLPPREDLVAMQRARIVIGLGPEAGDVWMGLVGLPAAARVELAEGAWGESLVAREGVISHRHGPTGAHTHVEREPCPWVEPRRGRELIDHVRAELARRGLGPRAPSPETTSLELELQRLAARLDAIAGVELLASHGAYRYLATRPGWSVEVAGVETSVPPTDTALAAFEVVRTRRPGARILLVAGPPHAGWVDALARADVACAIVPLDGDGRYFDGLALALDDLARRLESR